MPQQAVIVFHKDSGEPMAMHSIDAAEALRQGDYVSALLGDAKASPEQMANARARLKGADALPFPDASPVLADTLATPPEEMRKRDEEAKAHAPKLPRGRLADSTLTPPATVVPSTSSTASLSSEDNARARRANVTP